MKIASEIPETSRLSHDQIMALVARGRAERNAYIASQLSRQIARLRVWLHKLRLPAASGLRLRHH